MSTAASELPELPPPKERAPGMGYFWGSLLVLVLLRLAIGFISMPNEAIWLGNAVFTILFIALPVFAIFQASKGKWTGMQSLLFVVAGVLLQAGGMLLSRGPLAGQGLLTALLVSIAQAGLILWCTGLGAAIALLIKDKNLLIPVSVFLAGFDVFLVFSPVGATQAIMKAAPDALPSVALQIPSAQSAPTSGPVAPFAFVGPADLLFMGMFFVALHKFGMRSRQTAIWLIPTILVYLLLSLFVPAIPLLVPIGLCVLAVNAREFQMTKEEKLSTGLIGVIAVALAASAFLMPRPPAAPSTGELAPEQQELAETPAQAPPSRSP